MKTEKYSGLFEDEISELLSTLPDNAYIHTGFYTSYGKKTGGTMEDGIFTPYDGSLFIEYINGKLSSYVGKSYLVGHLAHTEFTVTTY